VVSASITECEILLELWYMEVMRLDTEKAREGRNFSQRTKPPKNIL